VKRFFDSVHVQRRALTLIFAAILVLGAYAALRLPSSILPEVTFPRVTILADSGELPSDAMMRGVTRPLEESIRRVPGVLEVRSATSRGSAEINLDCAWTSDMNLTLQRVQAQVEAVRPRLAPGTTLDTRLMNPTLFPVLGFSMTSDRVSLARLRDVAVLLMTPELSRLPGVAEVIVQGGRRLEARITLDPAALQARGLDAAGVADVVRNASVLESVGLLESNQELYLGLADGRPTDLASLGDIPVPIAAGPPVALGQLGRIQLEDAPEFTRYRAQGREAVLVSVLRQPAASAITLSDAIHRWLRENRRRLPAGVRIETFYDQSELVRASARSVRDSLLVGALLAILIIIVFLRSLRLGVAGALVLPGSIAGTLIGLSLAHQSLNMMTLGGIAAAVGLVLDDAIVVVEHLAARSSGPDACSRSHAMAEITPTLVGSSACTLAILAPFVLLGGVTGAFFRVLSLSMALMLGVSLLLCLTLVPLTSPDAQVIRAPLPGAPRGVRGAFGRAMRFAAGNVWVGFAAVVLCVGLAVPLYATLGTGFLPEMDEGALILDYVAPPGSSLTETDRMLQELEKEIARTPEVVAWSRRTGDQLGFFITEPNIGDYVLRLRPGRRRSAEEVADDLRARIESVLPAVEVEFGQLVEDVIGDLTTNPQPIEVRVFSEDRAMAEAKAREVAALLARVRGVVDIKAGVVVSGPTVTIAPGAAAARLGLSAGDLARTAAPAIAGVEVGAIVRGARAWTVRVVLPRPPGLSGTAALAALPISLGEGRRATLGSLATVRTDPGETEIARDNLRTMVGVTARLSGRDLGSAMAEIERRVRRELVLPPEATIHYAGLWAEQQSSFRGLVAVLIGAVALVTLILLFSFRSWYLAAAVLMVVVSSLIGVLGALHLGGASFNISSFVGAIMMVGIVSENAYFLVESYCRHRSAGRSGPEAAHAAAVRRTRPVLMTTFAGVAALAPLALGVGAGSALLKPLALAVVGGFVTSAFLLLLVLPSLLGRFGRPPE
jgi:multidrug efflux pump subunit AcrB